MINIIKTKDGEMGYVLSSEGKGSLKVTIKIINTEGEEEIRVVDPTELFYVYPPTKPKP